MVSEYINNDFNTLKKNVEGGNGVFLYHCTELNSLKGILKNGTDRDWTGKNSNTYGSGFYTTFKLSSSEQNSRGHIYGGYIIKFFLVGGLDGFLIFDPGVARKVYGEWNIPKQIEMLCPPDIVEKLKRSSAWPVLTRRESQLGHCSKTGGKRTADLAYAFFDQLKGNRVPSSKMTEFQRKRGAVQYTEDLLRKTNVKGYVFQGNNDGYVCFVRDFKALVPVAYRDLNGKWHDCLKEDTFNNIKNSSDAAFSFMGKYPETNTNEKAIDGFIVVKKDGKYNYVNIATGEELLPVWADSAYAFDANEHEATFIIKGQEFTTNGKYFSDSDGFSYDMNEFKQELKERQNIDENNTLFEKIVKTLKNRQIST